MSSCDVALVVVVIYIFAVSVSQKPVTMQIDKSPPIGDICGNSW